MGATSKIPAARVWLADGTAVEVETRKGWEAIVGDVIFVAQKLPAGGHFPAQGDYYWLGSDGEVQYFVGSDETLARTLALDGDKRGSASPSAKKGVTILRTAYNALMVEGMSWARGAPCEGC